MTTNVPQIVLPEQNKRKKHQSNQIKFDFTGGLRLAWVHGWGEFVCKFMSTFELYFIISFFCRFEFELLRHWRIVDLFYPQQGIFRAKNRAQFLSILIRRTKIGLSKVDSVPIITFFCIFSFFSLAFVMKIVRIISNAWPLAT